MFRSDELLKTNPKLVRDSYAWDYGGDSLVYAFYMLNFVLSSNSASATMCHEYVDKVLSQGGIPNFQIWHPGNMG